MGWEYDNILAKVGSYSQTLCSLWYRFKNMIIFNFEMDDQGICSGLMFSGLGMR